MHISVSLPLFDLFDSSTSGSIAKVTPQPYHLMDLKNLPRESKLGHAYLVALISHIPSQHKIARLQGYLAVTAI